MTSFAFILGVVPLVLAEGAGAEMRQALGTAVFSGMLGVTFFGLLLTPVFYVVIRWLTERKPKPAPAAIAEPVRRRRRRPTPPDAPTFSVEHRRLPDDQFDSSHELPPPRDAARCSVSSPAAMSAPNTRSRRPR